jgi:hypothetical protein
MYKMAIAVVPEGYLFYFILSIGWGPGWLNELGHVKLIVGFP